MRHTYTRHTFKADGTRHAETLELTGEQVAMTLGGHVGGRRDSFLELVNRWNRAGLASSEPGAPRYIFVAEVTSS